MRRKNQQDSGSHSSKSDRDHSSKKKSAGCRWKSQSCGFRRCCGFTSCVKRWVRCFFWVYFLLFCSQCAYPPTGNEKGFCGSFEEYVVPVGREAVALAEHIAQSTRQSRLWVEMVEPTLVGPSVGALDYVMPGLAKAYAQGDVTNAMVGAWKTGLALTQWTMLQSCRITRACSTFVTDTYDKYLAHHPSVKNVAQEASPYVDQMQSIYKDHLRPCLVWAGAGLSHVTRDFVFPVIKSWVDTNYLFLDSAVVPPAIAGGRQLYAFIMEKGFPFCSQQVHHVLYDYVPQWADKCTQCKGWSSQVQPYLEPLQTYYYQSARPWFHRNWKLTKLFYAFKVKPKLGTLNQRLWNGAGYLQKEWLPKVGHSLDKVLKTFGGEELYHQLHEAMSRVSPTTTSTAEKSVKKEQKEEPKVSPKPTVTQNEEAKVGQKEKKEEPVQQQTPTDTVKKSKSDDSSVEKASKTAVGDEGVKVKESNAAGEGVKVKAPKESSSEAKVSKSATKVASSKVETATTTSTSTKKEQVKESNKETPASHDEL